MSKIPDPDYWIKRKHFTVIPLSDLCCRLLDWVSHQKGGKKSQQYLEFAKSKLIQCCFCVPGVNPRARDARNILVTQHKARSLSVRRLSDFCQTGSLLVGQHCLPCSHTQLGLHQTITQTDSALRTSPLCHLIQSWSPTNVLVGLYNHRHIRITAYFLLCPEMKTFFLEVKIHTNKKKNLEVFHNYYIPIEVCLVHWHHFRWSRLLLNCKTSLSLLHIFVISVW